MVSFMIFTTSVWKLLDQPMYMYICRDVRGTEETSYTVNVRNKAEKNLYPIM